MLKEGIAVVDFGGQYAHLIADRVKRVVYDITHKPPATIEWE